MTGVTDAERGARVVLSRLCEPGDPHACRLVRDFSALELLDRIAHKRDGEAAKLADWRQRLPSADYTTMMRSAMAISARYLCPGDAEWPAALDDLVRLEGLPSDRMGGVPFGLWVRGGGDLAALSANSIAIVGARSATAYGEHVAGDIAFGCGTKHWTVVSGGAYGIDAAAHRGALSRERPTIAVLAGGVDRLYPAGNAQLLRDIAVTGLVVSEAAPGCAPSKSRFLVRNRLIAGLTAGTLVIEAALRSGSLNTARWALDLDRAVMGVPGPVTSMVSAGVHELLRQPGTLLVTDAAEAVEHVSSIGEGLAPRKSGVRRLTDELGSEARQLLDAFPPARSAAVETLAREAGLRPGAVREHLAHLERWGEVTRDGTTWRLVPRTGP